MEPLDYSTMNAAAYNAGEFRERRVQVRRLAGESAIFTQLPFGPHFSLPPSRFPPLRNFSQSILASRQTRVPTQNDTRVALFAYVSQSVE
jgi:hypothetical protein